MKKLFLTFCVLLVCLIGRVGYAQTLEEKLANVLDNKIKKTYWVYVQLNDKSKVAVDPTDLGGLSNKGDVVAIVEYVAGQEPTPKEKEYYLILKSDLTEFEKQRLLMPYWEVDTEAGRTRFESQKAFRKYKIDLQNMGIDAKKGLLPVKQDVQSAEITSVQLSAYEWNRRKYVYFTRPIKMVMNVLVPMAQATDNISKICAVGANCTNENYNSIGAWESAVDGNLVIAQTVEIGELYDDDGNFNEDFAIDGSTTNSSYYMYLRAAFGEEHNGDFTAGVAVSQSGTFSYTAAIGDNYTRLEGFRLIQDNYIDYGMLTLYSGTTNVYINRMFLANTQTWGGEETTYGISLWCDPDCYLTAENTVFAFQNGTGGFHRDHSKGHFTIYASTIYGQSSTERVLESTVTIYNSIVWNYDTSGPTIGNYNCLSDTNAIGVNDLTSQAGTDIDFVDTTENAWDLHIQSTSSCKDQGNDYSGSMITDTDIDIKIRSGTWDIGADELAAATPTAAVGHPRTLRYGTLLLLRGTLIIR